MAMGEPSPSRLLQRMRPSEFALWRALFRVEPWDERRADLRMALNTHIAAAAHFKRRDGGEWTPQHFMPYAGGATDTDAAAHNEYTAARYRFAHLIVTKDKAHGTG